MIKTQRLLLVSPTVQDAKRMAEYEASNRAHWTSFASSTAGDATQEAHWQQKLRSFEEESDKDLSVRFLLTDLQNPTGQIIGTCNFTQIFRGPFQAGYLGYKIDQQFEGKGFMFEALQAAIAYMFTEQNLHRIMANYVPTNNRSEKLLNRLGFVKEGYAKNYLLINGTWQDHVLTALTNPNWKAK